MYFYVERRKMDFVLPQCSVSVEAHQARREICLIAGQELETSVRSRLWNELITNLTCGMPTSLLPRITMSNDKRWANLPFGAVNTIEASACVALVSKYMLDFFGYNVPFMDVVEEIVQKGYRQWKFGNRSKTLAFPTIELNEIKSVFKKDERIQACKSLEELYNVAGNPVGIGGSAYALDQLAVMLANFQTEAYTQTRIRSVVQIVKNLRKCIPVPIRVSNAIYHNDQERSGGHYVVLTGLANGTATVMDSSEGERQLPAQQLFKAIIKDPGLIAAWDFSNSMFSS